MQSPCHLSGSYLGIMAQAVAQSMPQFSMGAQFRDFEKLVFWHADRGCPRCWVCALQRGVSGLLVGREPAWKRAKGDIIRSVALVKDVSIRICADKVVKA